MKIIPLAIVAFLAVGCAPRVAELPAVTPRIGDVQQRLPAPGSPAWNPAWYATTTIDWDPSGANGGNDSNSCSSSGASCLTWGEIARRYGSTSPTLGYGQVLTVNILSGQTAGTDAVVFNPHLWGGAYVNFQCALPAPVATGTLSNVTAKNRSTPHNLTATLPGSGLAAGQMIVNATHASRAFIQATGTPATITQPLAACVTPNSAENPPAEVDTWANGDSVSIYQLYRVAFGGLNPDSTSDGSSFNAGVVYVNQCDDWSFGDVSAQSNVNGSVFVQESGWNRQTLMNLGGAFIEQAWTNVYDGSRLTAYTGNPGNPVELNAGFYSVLTGGSFGLDGDVMVGLEALLNSPSGFSQLGLVDILSGGLVQLLQGPVEAFFITYGQPTIWGAGALQVNGTTRLSYPAGAGKAAATFLQTGGFTLNGSSSCALGTQAGVITSGKTLTAAHLDTDLGAVAGSYFVPGGASVGNGGF